MAPPVAQAVSPHYKNRNLLKLDAALQQFASKGEFSGVVRISKAEKIVYEGVFGLADHEKQFPMRSDHFLDIGSITKQFTAAAILRLHEQGKLSLFDSLDKFFSLNKNKGHITLMHLITHRSGLGVPGDKVFDEMSKLENGGDAVGYFQLFFERAPRRRKPGTTFYYNNMAYSALAHIIDRVSGQSFEDFLKNEFFQKFDIACGFGDGISVPEDRRAYGSYKGKNTMRAGDALRYLGYRGSTSVVSTAKGLGDWAAALLTRQVFNKNYSTYFLLNGIPAEYHTPAPMEYSFGWFLDSHGSVWHDGSVNGFVSSLKLDLKRKISVVVLSNLDKVSPEVFDHIAARAFPAPSPERRRARVRRK